MTAFGAVLGFSSQALFLEVITEKADGTSAPPIKISSRCGKTLIRILRQAKAEYGKLQ